jgi:hypothetical protein
MTSGIIARRFTSSVLVLLMVSSAWVAHGQQAKSNVLSDNDKAEIIESMLELESSAQSSEFENIRKLSSENIDFDASRISGLGYTLLTASQIRDLKKDRVIKYVVVRKIYSRDGVVFVSLARVTEGRPCFGAIFSSERSLTYEFQKNAGEWIGQLIRSPALQLTFGKNLPTKA